MNETTIFPREKKADFLFEKILNDPWACEKLQETFANYLCYNDDAYDAPLPAEEFAQALFNSYQILLHLHHTVFFLFWSQSHHLR